MISMILGVFGLYLCNRYLGEDAPTARRVAVLAVALPVLVVACLVHQLS